MSEPARTPFVSVVIPVRNEPAELVQDLMTSVQSYGWEAVVVDDGSVLPVPGAAVRHATSKGYGASLKAGIRVAQGYVVATMDGDGQHNPYDIKRLYDYFWYRCPNGTAYEGPPAVDMIVGDRRVQEPTLQRWLGRKLLNWTASLFAGRWIPDLNSGLRMFRREIALGYEPILSDGFSFTTSLTVAMLSDGYTVDWLPIKVLRRKAGASHVRLWRDGLLTLRQIFWVGLACRTRRLRAFWRSLP